MNDVIEKEWVVEQYYDGKLRVIGKVIPKNKTLFFNNDDLEAIWDLANWGCSQPKEIEAPTDIYEFCRCFENGNLIYADMGKTTCCNDDIFIRRHYDLDNGFWIKSDRRVNKDEWVYSEKDEFINHKNNNEF